MGQEPEVIRQQIAQTRNDMEQTVDALGYKADVKARAKENVQGKVDAVGDRVTAVKEKIVGTTTTTPGNRFEHGTTGHASGAASTISEAAGSAKTTIGSGADDVKENARRAAGVAQENPLGLAIGAIAVGFLGGLLIPATKVENEKIGPMADDLKGQAREAGHDAFEHGKAVAEDAVDAAREAVRASAETAQGAARDAAQTTAESARGEADRAGSRMPA